MQPPDSRVRSLVERWLDKAELDFRLALHIASKVDERGFGEGVGFHCQQGAEKFLKGLLTHVQVEFPKTHSLSALLELAAEKDMSLDVSSHDAKWLSMFGVDIRYPDDSSELLPGDELRAIEIATRIKNAVLHLIRR